MITVHFDERDDAVAFCEDVVRARTASGPDPIPHRDEFAGEDDAEDAAWLVEVDLPRAVADDLAERHGGWCHEPDRPGGAVPLPSAPRRIKNPSSPRREGR